MTNSLPTTAGRPLAGRSLRRKAMLGFAVVAAVLAAGGPALACISFRGQMTLIGEDGVPHVVTASGMGYHGYCSAPGNGGPVVLANVANQPIVVRVGPANCPSGKSGAENTLAPGAYQVALVNGPGYKSATSSGYLGAQSLQDGWGCFSSGPVYEPPQKHTGFPGSAFTIDSAGVGTTVISVPSLSVKNNTPTAPSDASVLCVGTATTPGSNPGIFAPFTVL